MQELLDIFGLISPRRALEWLYNYARIGDYFKAKISGLRKKKHVYEAGKGNALQKFWRDSLGIYYAREKRLTSARIKEGELVELKGFRFFEWLPIFPGRVWTEPRDIDFWPITEYDYEDGALDIFQGKATIRFTEHNGYKLLSAIVRPCSNIRYSIPVAFSHEAYRKLKPYIEKD